MESNGSHGITDTFDLSKAIRVIEASIDDPTRGLPEEVFLFISRIVPLANVDLLIQDELGQTLLTWREDGYSPPGWHVPGGIIRYKETAADRIKQVAAHELGATVLFKSEPLLITEIILPLINRAHGISLLYECRLESLPDIKLRYERGQPRPGEWAWHKRCPENLLKVHEMYRKYMCRAEMTDEERTPCLPQM